MSLTPDQVKLIKATVPVLKDHGTIITAHFYELLLKENPSLNGIFNQTNQKTGHQAGALAGSLYAYASHIDDLGVLSPAVEKICHKHASMYVRPEHYDVVGTYLLRAMGDVLGEALTPEILEAWGQAYWQLANIVSTTFNVTLVQTMYTDSSSDDQARRLALQICWSLDILARLPHLQEGSGI